MQCNNHPNIHDGYGTIFPSNSITKRSCYTKFKTLFSLVFVFELLRYSDQPQCNDFNRHSFSLFDGRQHALQKGCGMKKCGFCAISFILGISCIAANDFSRFKGIIVNFKEPFHVRIDRPELSNFLHVLSNCRVRGSHTVNIPFKLDPQPVVFVRSVRSTSRPGQGVNLKCVV